jgi:hypothetical protein
MPVPAWKPRPRAAATVVVLGLHLLLLAGALRLGVWPERTPQHSRPPIAVRLIWQRLVAAAPDPARTPPPEARPLRPTPRAVPQPPDRPTLPTTLPTADPALQAITLPASTPPAPTPAAASAAAPAPPLNLALPRAASAPWRQRSPALDDARSNTPTLTLEQKLAMAMGGDGAWVEEIIDADHRRMRRGNLCVYLQRPAAAQLDPFHQASRHLPWQAGRPTRCD